MHQSLSKLFLSASMSLLTAAAITTGAGMAQSDSAAALKIAARTPAVVESCSVVCTDPHPACSESARVIETLNKLTQLINEGNFDAMSEYFDDGVTTFNEDTSKLIVGKAAVLADIKERYQRRQKAEGRLVSYTIDTPYAYVHGNSAVVTFVAKKVISGPHPIGMESHSTEVFVKDGEKWKTLHYRGAWKKVAS